jgi:hypothetical protein
MNQAEIEQTILVLTNEIEELKDRLVAIEEFALRTNG